MKSIRPIPGNPIPDGWFAALWDDVRSMLCRGDGCNIFVTQTPTGQCVRYHGDETPSPLGDADDCIFKIRLLDATHVSVSYGVVVVNGEIREVAAVASLPIVQPCWIYIESSASTDTIRSSSSIPVQTTGNGARGVFPLGKVVSNKVSQYSRGVPTILLIGAECEEESSSGSAEE